MAIGTRVNPALIRPGDEVATKYHPDTLQVYKARTVKKAEPCPGKAELFHIDGHCYDTRFSTVVKK